MGYNIKKAITEEYFYKDRDSQINAIEKTFSKAKEEVTVVSNYWKVSRLAGFYQSFVFTFMVVTTVVAL